jgi:anti-sigma factor RsiW
MNEKILERLLADRALGGLSPDVAALLEAYLEIDPAQASLRREMDETVRLAARALPRPRSRPLPPPKFAACPSEIRVERLAWRSWWPVELAAAFVLGLALGLGVLRPSQPLASRTGSDALATAPSSPASPSSPPAFWSMARLVKPESNGSAPAPPRIAWSSPVRQPQLIQ